MPALPPPNPPQSHSRQNLNPPMGEITAPKSTPIDLFIVIKKLLLVVAYALDLRIDHQGSCRLILNGGRQCSPALTKTSRPSWGLREPLGRLAN